jgi:hypothetical protein
MIVVDGHRPRIEVAPASTVALKLLALAAMVADHLDWLVLDGALGFHDTWGRAVFPIFAALLALNLSRMDPRRIPRVLVPRLLLFGVLAAIPYTLLQGAVLPLNIMFTLAAGATLCWLCHRHAYLPAALLFSFCGLFVDYGWFGLLAILVPWALNRVGFNAGLLIAAALVVPVNGSAWSFAACLAGLATGFLPGYAPRLKWLFYAAYPLHLVVLWILAA